MLLILINCTLSDKDSVRKRGRRGRHQQEEADQDQAKILKVNLLFLIVYFNFFYAIFFLGFERRR